MFHPEGIVLLVSNQQHRSTSDQQMVPRNRLYPIILRSAKEIYQVASKSLYSNAFYMDGTCHAVLRFLERLPRHYRLMIKDLRLSTKAVFFDDVDNRCHGDLIKLLTGNETNLSSVTIPVVDEKPQFYIDALFCRLGQAVFRGRLPEVRLHCRDANPHPDNLESLDEILSAADMYAEYERSIGVVLCRDLVVKLWNLSFGRLEAPTPARLEAPTPARLKEIRTCMTSVIHSYRALYPFTISIGHADPGEVGLIVLVQAGSVQAAKLKIRELQGQIGRGELDGDSHEEALALHPLSVPNLRTRLASAWENLEKFEQRLLHTQQQDVESHS